MEHRRSQSIVREKSFRFAVHIVDYIRRQPKDHISLVLTRQLLRSGTSIGANVEEALGGHSSKDFVAKLAIAAKEARETEYWLRLVRETQSHNQQDDIAGLLIECDGLLRMLNSIILTTRSKLHSPTQSETKGRTSDLRTSNSEPRTQNSELGGAVNSEPRTQNSELNLGRPD